MQVCPPEIARLARRPGGESASVTLWTNNSHVLRPELLVSRRCADYLCRSWDTPHPARVNKGSRTIHGTHLLSTAAIPMVIGNAQADQKKA